MHSDPIFIIASAIAIAVLLASAATHKVRAPARFRKQLGDYQLLPEALVRPRCTVDSAAGTGHCLRLVGAGQPALGGVVRGWPVGSVRRRYRHQPVARSSRHRLRLCRS